VKSHRACSHTVNLNPCRSPSHFSLHYAGKKNSEKLRGGRLSKRAPGRKRLWTSQLHAAFTSVSRPAVPKTGSLPLHNQLACFSTQLIDFESLDPCRRPPGDDADRCGFDARAMRFSCITGWFGHVECWRTRFLVSSSRFTVHGEGERGGKVGRSWCDPGEPGDVSPRVRRVGRKAEIRKVPLRSRLSPSILGPYQPSALHYPRSAFDCPDEGAQIWKRRRKYLARHLIPTAAKLHNRPAPTAARTFRSSD
jgi:hypothetical protein